jgi:UDP-N-acetylmuramoylalanine--D-glutamate ligase
MSELLLGEEPGLYVAEVSSFQLETIRTFRPKVALWLNLSPNHLDRYPSMAEYREAKLRIFLNQTAEDWAVVPYGSELPPIKVRTITFSTTDPGADLTLAEGSQILHKGKLLFDMGLTELRGPHNAANLMAAFGAGIALGADPITMAAAVGNYVPPAHRCEAIAVKRGVTWINDSKATNLDAMEQAIRSISGPLLLIAGGKDKGFEFSPIAPLVRERVSRAILIGEMRHRIARDWSPVPTEVADTLDEAVAAAAATAEPGSTILFSPGTSSFDMFRDYVRRGEEFRRLVLALPDDSPST